MTNQLQALEKGASAVTARAKTSRPKNNQSASQADKKRQKIKLMTAVGFGLVDVELLSDESIEKAIETFLKKDNAGCKKTKLHFIHRGDSGYAAAKKAYHQRLASGPLAAEQQLALIEDPVVLRDQLIIKYRYQRRISYIQFETTAALPTSSSGAPSGTVSSRVKGGQAPTKISSEPGVTLATTSRSRFAPSVAAGIASSREAAVPSKPSILTPPVVLSAAVAQAASMAERLSHLHASIDSFRPLETEAPGRRPDVEVVPRPGVSALMRPPPSAFPSRLGQRWSKFLRTLKSWLPGKESSI